ncbi:hypothetical protein GCM10009678_68410 [Actinomadura kijaniata]
MALECGGSVAAGTLWGRPVIASIGVQGGILVWDIEEDGPAVELDEPDGLDDPALGHFAVATVDDRAFVVAAGERNIAVCDVSDPDAPVWADPLSVPGGGIECLDVAVVGGRTIAATGGQDGALCVWDVADGRLPAGPDTAHRSGERDALSEVFAVRFTELNGRSAAITAGRDGTVRVWNLPEFGSDEHA